MGLPKAGSPAHLYNGGSFLGPPSPLHRCALPRGVAPPLTTLPCRAAEPNYPSSPGLSSKGRNDFPRTPLNIASTTHSALQGPGIRACGLTRSLSAASPPAPLRPNSITQVQNWEDFLISSLLPVFNWTLGLISSASKISPPSNS